MITNFKIFEKLKLSDVKDLTYGDLIELNKLDREIKDYFMKKYPSVSIKFLGRYGHELSDSTLNRLSGFAKKHNDKFLYNLVKNRIQKVEEFIKDPELFRNARKYNI